MDDKVIRVKFRVENEDDLQGTFTAFFRTMGCQMAAVKKPGRRGAVTVSSSMNDRLFEGYSNWKGFFEVDVFQDGHWEIDLDNEIVTIPLLVRPSEGLLEAIDYFEEEENRVVHPRHLRSVEKT